MSAKKPNLLLILADQLRFDAMGCSGHPLVKTPNLDRLAQTGQRFVNGYSETPVCVAARSMLITGRHGHCTGILDNDPVRLDELPTLPKLLGNLGYATQAIGKMHFHPKRNHLGFDRMLLSEDLVLDHVWDDDYGHYLQQKGFGVLREPHGTGHPYGAGSGSYYRPDTLPIPDEHSNTAWVADRTIDYIEANADRPYFCFTSFVKPHPPFHPPAPYDTMYEPADVILPPGWDDPDVSDPLLGAQSRFKGMGAPSEDDIRRVHASYYGLVTQLDHHIGRILDSLERTGQLDHTVILFSADHGELLGDHGHYGKRSFLEGAAKIPYIVSCPGLFASGQQRSKPVGLADILPTFVELAGGRAPAGTTGRSLVPLLNDGDDAPWREWLLGEYTGFHAIVNIEDKRISGRFMVRWEEWKYIYYVNGGREQLFHLGDDPRELRCLAAERPALCRTAKELLANRFRDDGFDTFLDDGTMLALPFRDDFEEVIL